MSSHPVTLGLLIAAVLACCVLPAIAAPVIGRAAVPPDGKITLTEYGYRDWEPEPVSFTIDVKKFPPKDLRLTDGAGNRVPFQVDGNTLTFIASLKRGTAATYTLARGGGAATSTLKTRAEGRDFVVENEYLSLRMPAPGAKTFAPPAEATAATPPITAWGCVGGQAVGSARFLTARKVAAQTFTVLRNGPAVVEYEARYTFEPKGEYVWRLRLSPGMPAAIITEEFDFNEITKGDDTLLLDLHKGWQPQQVGVVNGAGEQQLPTLSTFAYAAYLDNKRKSSPVPAPVGGTGIAPEPFKPAEGAVLLEQIFPGGRWGNLKGGIEVYDGEAGAGRTLGVVPLYLGTWRRSMAMNAWYGEAGVSVALPISVRYSRWSLDVTDDHSPFSTHEHDEGLKETYGRRVWGLFAGKEFNLAQARYGYIGLDRYKDWLVDYPETAGPKAYPGAFFAPEQIAQLRKSLDGHPDADFLKTWYLISGNTEHAVAHAQRVIDGLKAPYGENDLFLVALSNYRKSQFLAFACQAEDALACPDLPAETRKELRRRLTLYAYITSDPDFNPRGAGVHLGNNNMSINRTLALSYFAGLLPDHPLYKYWMECAQAFAQYKYGTHFAVDGANLECPSYALYSPYRTLNITQNVLRNRGFYDFAPDGYQQQFVRWLSYLSMPDARWGGLRIIPGMGNSSNQFENFWGFTMAAQVKTDPEFAGWLRFMNRLANGNAKLEPGPNGHDNVKSTPHALYYLPYVPEKPLPMETVFMPTYGVAFRHRFNTPAETAMLFRGGMNWGHWDTDPLNVILYGHGAPLSPGTEYQYYSGEGPWSNWGIYHNQVKVGGRNVKEVFGRVDGAVTDYGFGPHADYAVASRFYPSQIFPDKQGAMSWNRHVLFLKSEMAEVPDYFLMRDTFAGGETRPTWWNWMNLETPERIEVDGTAFAATAPINKTVPEAEMPAQKGQAVEMKTDYGASTWFWFSEPRTVRIRMIANYNRQDGKGGKQNKSVVEIPGAPKQDYFYLVYPRKNGAAVPACQSAAPGVMRVTTAASTDYLFLSDAPFNYSEAGVVFSGKAGAIRVFPDRVVFCMNAGSGRIGYKGYILEGPGPFERVVKTADLQKELNYLGVHPVTGGYEKKRLTVDLGREVKVSGEGPFTATLDGDTVRIRTTGRARVLHVTQPPFIVRPQYYIDGREWMPCWTDYPDSGWGSFDNTWLIGLSVPDGEHDLVVKDLVYPKVWDRPFTPVIQGVVIGEGPK
ncbi:MAG: hypothetical protein ACYC7E_08770 [Armatimonadota bacterium]